MHTPSVVFPDFPHPPDFFVDAEQRPLWQGKAYGSIKHLPHSRMSTDDQILHIDAAKRCTEKCRDGDVVYVQEKLDGSCVSAYRPSVDGHQHKIIALGRGGDLAQNSQNEGRRLWAAFVEEHRERFLAVLEPDERIVGEWLCLVHGTRYTHILEPFVAFDILRGHERLGYAALQTRLQRGNWQMPLCIHQGGALSVDEAIQKLGSGAYQAMDPVEGAIWRIERLHGKTKKIHVDLIAKYVRPDKIDGRFLPEKTGASALWNWHPFHSTVSARL